MRLPSSSVRRVSSVEAVVLVAVAATVFAVAMGSSSVSSAVSAGRPLRWLSLVALACLAVPYGWAERKRAPQWLPVVLAGIVALGFLSAAWSVSPRLTVERTGTFLVLAVAALLIGCGAQRSEGRRERLGVALLIGPVAVAVAGLVVLAVDHSLAVAAAQATMPARLRGFGENPNTSAMLFALASPAAASYALSGRAARVRLAGAGVFVLLYGSILASGSRGAIVAAGAGVAVTAATQIRGAAVRLAVVAAAVGGVVLSLAIFGARPSASAAPLPTQAAAPSGKSGPAVATGPRAAPPARVTTAVASATGATGLAVATPSKPSGRWSIDLAPTLPQARVPAPFVPSNNEIGYPGLYEYKPILTYGSGRVYAWIYAIRLGLKAPILGYGFGTEAKVFQDRLYYFDGAYTENSFVGLFLQLGAVGVLIFLAPFALIGLAVIRTLTRRAADERRVVAMSAGMVAAGFVVAFFQSYLYSVGNVATVTFWIAVCAAAVTLASARDAPALS